MDGKAVGAIDVPKGRQLQTVPRIARHSAGGATRASRRAYMLCRTQRTRPTRARAKTDHLTALMAERRSRERLAIYLSTYGLGSGRDGAAVTGTSVGAGVGGIGALVVGACVGGSVGHAVISTERHKRTPAGDGYAPIDLGSKEEGYVMINE